MTYHEHFLVDNQKLKMLIIVGYWGIFRPRLIRPKPPKFTIFSHIRPSGVEISSDTLQKPASSIFDYQPENVHDMSPLIPMLRTTANFF